MKNLTQLEADASSAGAAFTTAQTTYTTTPNVGNGTAYGQAAVQYASALLALGFGLPRNLLAEGNPVVMTAIEAGIAGAQEALTDALAGWQTSPNEAAFNAVRDASASLQLFIQSAQTRFCWPASF